MKVSKPTDGLLKRNMVLSGGTLLAVSAAFCTRFSNALLFSFAFLFTGFIAITLTMIFFSGKNYIFQTAACALIAALAYIPFYLIAENIAPNLCDSAGIYLPLVTVYDVWLFRAQRKYFENFDFGNGMSHTFFYSLGVLIMLVIIGSIRELLAYGTLAGFKIFPRPSSNAASQVWAGLIIIGILAGIVRKFYSMKKDKNKGDI